MVYKDRTVIGQSEHVGSRLFRLYHAINKCFGRNVKGCGEGWTHGQVEYPLVLYTLAIHTMDIASCR